MPRENVIHDAKVDEPVLSYPAALPSDHCQDENRERDEEKRCGAARQASPGRRHRPQPSARVRKLRGILADYADPAAPLPKGSGVSLEALAAARHALSCGPIRELQDSVRQPLTLRRVLRNLTGAYGRTNLRIPPDPLAAERWACAAPGNRSKGKALTLRVIYARASQLAWTRRRQEEETGATGA